jgi:hypothetical protein
MKMELFMMTFTVHYKKKPVQIRLITNQRFQLIKHKKLC